MSNDTTTQAERLAAMRAAGVPEGILGLFGGTASETPPAPAASGTGDPMQTILIMIKMQQHMLQIVSAGLSKLSNEFGAFRGMMLNKGFVDYEDMREMDTLEDELVTLHQPLSDIAENEGATFLKVAEETVNRTCAITGADPERMLKYLHERLNHEDTKGIKEAQAMAVGMDES